MSYYEIHWNTKNGNGLHGHGKPLPVNIALSWKKHMDKKYPEINHYLVKIPIWMKRSMGVK